jgi:hypothetical protein
MSEQSSFLDLVIAGHAESDEIDNFVEKWHEGHDAADLSDYLGMRSDEYSLWLENPEMLALICAARRSRQSLAQAVNERLVALRLVAKPGDRAKLTSLQSWLRRQGVEV